MRFTMASKPAQTQLDTNLEKLKKLIKKNTEHGKHAVEISTILLWIATNHPKLLKNNSKELRNVSIEHLHFSESWILIEELVPTEALIELLKSRVCKDLRSFCGYVNAEVVKHIPNKVFTVRLALGDLINNVALLGELRRCQEKQPDGSIIIHLGCGKIKLEDLSELPDFHPKVYISEVSDNDTAWVIQAVTTLQPKINSLDPDIEALYLPWSELTASGVEAIAKGLFEAGITLEKFAISSSNINTDTKITGYEYSDEDLDKDSDEDSDEDSEKDSEKFCKMISKKYDFDRVSFTNELKMNFTDFQEYPSDLTISLLELEILADIKAGDSDSEYYF